MIILIILIIVLLLSLSFINKTLKKKETILEEVTLQENIIKNDGFALMLQQSDGTYKESESNLWPTDMKFNVELSGCIDVNGNKIENSLLFDSTTNFITLKTNKTSYCYVYFDIDNSATSYLIKNVSSEELWDSTLEGDGYRFVGTLPSNYICFGTSDKDTCVNDTDKYMYRIIGIFEDEAGNKHAKLIKKEALNTAYAWHSTNNNVDWDGSDLYNGLNGDYFLTNVEYSYMQDSTWIDKIATWNYTMANTKTRENYDSNSVYGLYYNGNTVKAMYLHELNRSSKSNETCYYSYGSDPSDSDCNIGEWKTLSTKISLMYASDYALSLGEVALNYVGTNNYSTMKTGWMHLSNNDANAPDSYEWTMSRYGKDSSGYAVAWTVDYRGYVSRYNVSLSNDVRPVFYLESNVEISGGSGTITDPYILGI